MKKYDKGEISEIILSTILVVGVIAVAANCFQKVTPFGINTPSS